MKNWYIMTIVLLKDYSMERLPGFTISLRPRIEQVVGVARRQPGQALNSSGERLKQEGPEPIYQSAGLPKGPQPTILGRLKDRVDAGG